MAGVNTDIHLNSEEEEFMMRRVDDSGTWMDAEGWVWIRLEEAKGHKIRLREMCVQVPDGSGGYLNKTAIVLCSEPY